MKTKNAKRLWPVPVTLGVMALAALLAFGLLATNGARPAAAQDALCFEVLPATVGVETCSVTGTGATVEFNGTATTTVLETKYYVYYPVSSGEAITLYPDNTVYLDNLDHDLDDGDDNGVLDTDMTVAATPKVTGYYSGDPATGDNVPKEVSAIKLGYKLIELDEAQQGAGGPEAQTDTIMVSGEAGDMKNVYVYKSAPTLAVVSKNPGGSTADITAKTLDPIVGVDTMVTITFLGVPALAFDADKGSVTGTATFYTDNDDDVNGSTVLVMTTGIARKGNDRDANADGYDDRSWVIPGGMGVAASEPIMITATIMDSIQGRPWLPATRIRASISP